MRLSLTSGLFEPGERGRAACPSCAARTRPLARLSERARCPIWRSCPGKSRHCTNIATWARDRSSRPPSWSTRLRSSSELLALAEVYTSDDAVDKIDANFAAVWNNVMGLDRFELAARGRGRRLDGLKHTTERARNCFVAEHRAARGAGLLE
jgi:hypothetical protein